MKHRNAPRAKRAVSLLAICSELTSEGDSRIARSARATPIGSLRPSIVLYDEPHPLGDEIGQLQTYDMRRGPDLLLIMGTSLKVHGLKRLVKDFARVVHDKKGIVVFVNATAPSKEWEGIIDYHIEGQTDTWVERLEEDWKKLCPRDWEKQTNLDGNVVFRTVAKTQVKGKGKGKKLVPEVSIQKRALPCEHIPLQLPTPPASQQSPPPSSEISDLSDLSDVLSSPPSSPCLSPSRTPTAPLTPVSPSKRGTPSTAMQRMKKSRVGPEPPPTGRLATPGRGNLFTESQVDNLLSSSDDSVFGSPSKSTPRSGPKSKKSAANSKAADVTKPKARRRAGATDKETAGLGSRTGMRRTNSLRAC